MTTRRMGVVGTVTVIALLIGCGIETTNGALHSGIETTNGATVVASASTIGGSAPPRALVSLFDSRYVPWLDQGRGVVTVSDDSGRYLFTNLDTGTYTVVVRRPEKNDAALFTAIVLDGSDPGPVAEKQLAPTGAITGEIAAMPDTVASLLVYCEGTGFSIILTAPGPFQIADIPAGSYDLVVLPLHAPGTTRWYAPVVISSDHRRTVSVTSGKTTTIDPITLP